MAAADGALPRRRRGHAGPETSRERAGRRCRAQGRRIVSLADAITGMAKHHGDTLPIFVQAALDLAALKLLGEKPAKDVPCAKDLDQEIDEYMADVRADDEALRQGLNVAAAEVSEKPAKDVLSAKDLDQEIDEHMADLRADNEALRQGLNAAAAEVTALRAARASIVSKQDTTPEESSARSRDRTSFVPRRVVEKALQERGRQKERSLLTTPALQSMKDMRRVQPLTRR